jgi:hypothetical protein
MSCRMNKLGIATQLVAFLFKSMMCQHEFSRIVYHDPEQSGPGSPQQVASLVVQANRTLQPLHSWRQDQGSARDDQASSLMMEAHPFSGQDMEFCCRRILAPRTLVLLQILHMSHKAYPWNISSPYKHSMEWSQKPLSVSSNPVTCSDVLPILQTLRGGMNCATPAMSHTMPISAGLMPQSPLTNTFKLFIPKSTQNVLYMTTLFALAQCRELLIPTWMPATPSAIKKTPLHCSRIPRCRWNPHRLPHVPVGAPETLLIATRMCHRGKTHALTLPKCTLLTIATQSTASRLIGAKMLMSSQMATRGSSR